MKSILFIMLFETSKEAILKGLNKQLSSFFDISEDEVKEMVSLSELVFKRCETCFAGNKNKYYWKAGSVYFNPFHSGQYTVFLYFFSNSVFNAEKKLLRLADKIYYLNKIMNSCDLFYEVQLPTIFMLDQPLGTVLGRATYGNYFKFTQNCTVGSNNDIFPTIGDQVTMTANSKIFGNCKIGKNVIIGVDSCIKDEDIPDNSLVFGQSPNLIIKKRKVADVMH